MLTIIECQAPCCYLHRCTSRFVFLNNVEKEKQWMSTAFLRWISGNGTAQRKINIIISDGMNLLKSLRLHEFYTGDIYVRQSKAEQWLGLISILMNANWHICYGGLAVQTLQLAWLINYPHAHWKWSLGNELSGGWKNRFKSKEKKTLNLHFYFRLCFCYSTAAF